MIVIKRRYIVGRGLGNLFKRLTSKISREGTKSTIKRIANSAIAHKVSDAVVNGAISATEKLVEDTIVKQLKRKSPPPAADDDDVEKKKKKKIGFGIIFD